MPCPHNEISIVQRSQQQSAIAAAAYQSGEKLFCEYDQQVKHYPEKRGIVHNEILLPANARWAKRYNLKEMSKTLIFLQENKIGSIEEMQERIDAATARYHELGDSIKATETRMHHKTTSAIIKYFKCCCNFSGTIFPFFKKAKIESRALSTSS